MMISKKYTNILIAAMMPLAISLAVAGIKTAAVFGLHTIFLYEWFRLFIKSYSIALPVSLLAAPFVRKIVQKITS